MILPPTSEISHHHKVTNITMSPTSLSPLMHIVWAKKGALIAWSTFQRALFWKCLKNMGEAVLLLGHIPPGELDTSKYKANFIWMLVKISKWAHSYDVDPITFLVEFCSKFFYQIVTRYSDTIRAQVGFHFFKLVNSIADENHRKFYGHTHWDHMRLFYEDYDKNKTGFQIYVINALSDWLISLANKHQLENLYKPVNVAYVTPSVTTWIGMDPSFRLIFQNESDWLKLASNQNARQIES